MGKFVWLASFPRSGNTWFRSFLANLLDPSGVSINQIPRFHCAARLLFDKTLEFPSSILSTDEINRLRPLVYRHWANEGLDELSRFAKVHDALSQPDDGEWMFPADITQAVIYIVRNPLDVCVSYSHFWGLNDYAKAADMLCDPEHSIPFDTQELFGQLYQHIGDWSFNVRSWCDHHLLPCLLYTSPSPRDA